MCYAIPGQVVRIDDGLAEIDYFGERKKAIAAAGVQEGDFVYAQAGIIVQTLPAGQARKLLSYWQNIFPELKNRDKELAKRSPSKNKLLEKTLLTAMQGKPLSDAEALALLNLEEKNELQSLYSSANEYRCKTIGNSSCTHAIIEFTNNCVNDCAYCGIRKSNAAAQRYRMTEQEILAAADFACNKLGFKSLVLQGGEDPEYAKKLPAIIEKILLKCSTVIFVSIGEAGEETYDALWNAGARGALIRFETSDRQLYSELHGSELSERVNCIEFAQKKGFQIVTGGIIGLPGQTKQSIFDDIKLCKQLKAEMYSFGPFIPHNKTPLANHCAPKVDEVLKVISLTRFIDPQAKILVTTALEKLAPQARRQGFLAGANSLMLSATPPEYLAKYDLYAGKTNQGALEKEVRIAQELLRELGRAPSDIGIIEKD